MKLNKISKKQRVIILKKLFPEGIREVKIWNGFVGCLKPKDYRPPSVEKLEIVADKKFKLKRRIQKFFPTRDDQLRLIRHGNIGMLHSITQTTWHFSGTHKVYAQDAVVLHGQTADQLVLDWAAQSVITMLLGLIKAQL